MEVLQLHFTIGLPPISKKNSQRIVQIKGRPIILPSKAYTDYEKAAKPFLVGLVNEPIDCLINIKAIFYMPTKRRCDLTNMLEALDDVLVKHKVIEDDNFNIVCGHDGSRISCDKENPRTEVWIDFI